MLVMYKSENIKLVTGIVMIFLCCLLHHCDLTSVFRLHSLLLERAFSSEYVQSPQAIENWVQITAVGRVLGAILIYKIIKQYGFFKSLLFTCLGHTAVSLLMLMLAFVQQNSFDMYYNALLTVRFMYGLFTPAAFVIPALYCFQIIPSKYHGLFSVSAAFIWPLTAIISRYFAEGAAGIPLTDLYQLFLTSGLLGLALYMAAFFV